MGIVCRLLTSIGQSPLFLLGLFFLTLAATHIFSVFSNNSNRFRLLSQWDDKEEELFKKICGRVAQGHVGILRLIHTLGEYRNNAPKKVSICKKISIKNITFWIVRLIM